MALGGSLSRRGLCLEWRLATRRVPPGGGGQTVALEVL